MALVEVVGEVWRFFDVTDVPVTIDSSSDDAPKLRGSFAPALGLEGINPSGTHAAESGLCRRVRVVLIALEGPLVPRHIIIVLGI